MVNLLNPAIATFYLVVVPSFIGTDAPQTRFAWLAIIHVTMALACHSAWAVALTTVRRIVDSPSTRRVLEAATGAALIGLALQVLL
jgi:threonine/homoserine/homoserine lactone efflux protein